MLSQSPELLHALAKHTEEAMGAFYARALATTVNGLASLAQQRAWRASDSLWEALAARSTLCAPEMTPQGSCLCWLTGLPR